MKQTIMKKYAALLATFCLCAALAPGLAFAVEEEYQAGSLADGTEVTTQADQEPAVAIPATLALQAGYQSGATTSGLSAAITGQNVLTSYNVAYQWYSAASDATPDVNAATPIDVNTEPTATADTYIIPAGKKAGKSYYYFCAVTLTSKTDSSEAPKLLLSNVATVTVTKATQVMPTNVEKVNESLKDSKDGAIVNVTKKMEWRLKSGKDDSWTTCKSTTLENLGVGTYLVRLKETDDYAASDPLEFTIGWDATSNVTIGSNAPKITVPNLNDIALNIKGSGDIGEDDSVEVDLAVSAIASNSNDADVTKIKAIAKDKTLTCFGMNLTQSINAGTATAITDLENDVLEINVEYTTKDRKNIVAYRVHGDKAEAFKSLSKKPTSDFTDGTYYVGDGTVTIYSSKFSTYALGYDTKANDANQQQNTTPATGDTLPGVVPFAIVAAIAIVAMVVARRFIRKTW